MRSILFAALFLAACGANAPSSPDDVPNDDALPFGAIVGNGENWRLVIDPTEAPGHMTLTFGDDEEVFSSAFSPSQSLGGGRYRIEGNIVVDIETAPCSFHQIAYPMRITVQPAGREAVTGCAAMRWDNQLIALLPQIDACLAASPQTRLIRYAGMNGDAVTVRMEGSEGQVDCTATTGPSPTAQITKRNYDFIALTEGDALFIRGPGENPGGECYTAPEIHDASGALIGWKMDPQGC